MTLAKTRMKFKGELLNTIRDFAKSPIGIVILIAFLVRVVFLLFVAKAYFGRENVFVDGDTYAWAGSFQSLLETGTYTANPGLEFGYFGRMPGYSFFIGFFYILAGFSWERAFPIVAAAQITLDSMLVFYIYRITVKLSGSARTGIISSVLFALYPFSIVWTPVVYSEQLSVFLIVLSFWYLLSNNRFKYSISASAIALSVLCRPQALLLVPLYLIYCILDKQILLRKRIISCCYFVLFFTLVYAGWPLRNYFLHGKIVLTQDIRGFYNWNEDVTAFLQYTYAVKAEWEPQYTQLIKNQHVVFPDEAYLNKEDSLKLEKAILLAQNCGSGFSHKSGFWKPPFDEPNCNAEIKKLFNELRQNQIKYNPANFYLKVPLKNLQKALFKSSLSDNASLTRKLASLLFYYRSLLIMLGVAGSVFMMLQFPGTRLAAFVILSYFLFLYLFLCAGTSLQMRNIEMRYFLPSDVLLLIPASFLINSLYRPHKIIKPVV